MGIYVKGMEIPKSCAECLNIGWQYVFECVIDDVEHGERKADCPLVTVPPHGRLIDADAFFDDLLFPSKQFEQGMRGLIGDAPTIIPAEPPKEE